VDYLATNADISLLADLELPNGEPAFNARELRHMEDVQAVYTGLTIAGAAAAISALGAAIVLLRSEAPPQAVPTAILQGCLFTVTLLGMVGAYMALSWNTFFTNFHRVFFEGDSWLFLYSDTLIRLFPMRFWIDVAIAIVAVLVAETIVVGGAGWWWRRSMSQQ
jgi:integral membrane protein (TIGR01906 family)